MAASYSPSYILFTQYCPSFAERLKPFTTCISQHQGQRLYNVPTSYMSCAEHDVMNGFIRSAPRMGRHPARESASYSPSYILFTLYRPSFAERLKPFTTRISQHLGQRLYNVPTSYMSCAEHDVVNGFIRSAPRIGRHPAWDDGIVFSILYSFHTVLPLVC